MIQGNEGQRTGACGIDLPPSANITFITASLKAFDTGVYEVASCSSRDVIEITWR